ncbi:hypothetical protein CYMTET_10216 [Cymbomonas tetramitiformis]|uniref:Exostosin GT47 domain-containing protein n=1 Tax=Cymbomonas tetramitiformis TaxID=36881 RepID=A0AAE0GPK5_9CHLO|nr:hypothetical protein CYMTET_10216 [Cymbomonas tetramitiformis]
MGRRLQGRVGRIGEHYTFLSGFTYLLLWSSVLLPRQTCAEVSLQESVGSYAAHSQKEEGSSTAVKQFDDFINLDRDKMLRELKIFSYERADAQKAGGQVLPPPSTLGKYSGEANFMEHLFKSNLMTNEPTQATLFLMPFSCTRLRWLGRSIAEGKQKAKTWVREYVQRLRSQYPWYNRTLGADHFYICAHDIGSSVGDLATPEDRSFQRNVIAMVYTAGYHGGGKGDTSYLPRGHIPVPQCVANMEDYAAGIGSRPRLAFFAGKPSGGARQKLMKLDLGDAVHIHISKTHMNKREYRERLRTSKFCLCPRGTRVWSPRLMEALSFGCVPVIIADHYDLPFQRHVDWSRLAVFVMYQDMAMLASILAHVSEHTWESMQAYARSVRHHFQWNEQPQHFDCFEALIYELWVRRHTVRYTPYEGGRETMRVPDYTHSALGDNQGSAPSHKGTSTMGELATSAPCDSYKLSPKQRTALASYKPDRRVSGIQQAKRACAELLSITKDCHRCLLHMWNNNTAN